MDRFVLHRIADATNVRSGIVAEGMRFSDGTVVVRWLADHNPASTVLWDSIDDAVYAGDGSINIGWIDESHSNCGRCNIAETDLRETRAALQATQNSRDEYREHLSNTQAAISHAAGVPVPAPSRPAPRPAPRRHDRTSWVDESPNGSPAMAALKGDPLADGSSG